METWKSGVGIVKKRKKKPPVRAPKQHAPPPRRSKPSQRAPPVAKKSSISRKKSMGIEQQIEDLNRKMRDCADNMDFRGASDYQKQIKALEAKLQAKNRDLAEDEKMKLVAEVRRRTPGLMDLIKGAMQPLIQAKEFKKCIALREDMVTVQKAAKDMESKSSEAEWRATYERFQETSQKYDQ